MSRRDPTGKFNPSKFVLEFNTQATADLIENGRYCGSRSSEFVVAQRQARTWRDRLQFKLWDNGIRATIMRVFPPVKATDKTRVLIVGRLADVLLAKPIIRLEGAVPFAGRIKEAK